MKPSRIHLLFGLLALAALFASLLIIPQRPAQAAMCTEIECHPGFLVPSPEPTDNPEGEDDGEPGIIKETVTPCTPSWGAPAITAAFTTDPAYPLTIGQDPDDQGVTVNGLVARGGANACPGGGPARITAFNVTRVQLAQSSISWINGELARKYPGAHVKDSYPFTPPSQVSGLGTPAAQLSFHFDPLDPGYYDVTLQATQEDGQSVTAVVRVPVYLMESTIIQ